MIENSQMNTKNIFSRFPEYRLEYSDAKISNPKVATTKEDSVEINGKKKGSKAGKIIFGSTLASTIIAAGIVGIILFKGGNKGATKKLAEIGERLTKDIQEANKLQSKDFMTKCNITCKKGIKKVLDFLQGISNTNAIKDGAVDSALRSNKITEPFAEKSKLFFKKIGFKSVAKKYQKVQVNIDDLTSILKHEKIHDLKQLSETQKQQIIQMKDGPRTLGELIDDLERYTKELGVAFDDGFSKDALVGRNKKRDKLLSGLSEKVKAKFFKNKGLFKLENYKTYATEELAKPAQDELSDGIFAKRKIITNNIQAIHDRIKTNLSNFSEQVKPDDEIAIKTIKTLKTKLEAFKSCSGAEEIMQREKISKEISTVIDDAISSISSNKAYSSGEQENLIKQLTAIKDTVISSKENSKGALEKIYTILKGLNEAPIGNNGKKLVTNSELKQYGKLTDKIRNELTKATELEAGEFFLKRGELEVGSAANDVLSILVPVGASSYAIAKGDNKDERVSAVLTTCIPLVGTFAAFVYGTGKMFAGPKNLIFSGVSGLVLGKLGNYCDKIYKEYKNSGSVVQVAKEECDKFWTEITPKYAEPLKEIEKTENTEKKENTK